MSWSERFTIGMGLVMSLAFYLQAWRIYRRRSAENISLWTFGLLGFVMTLWLLHGVATSDWTIVWEFLFAAFGAWLVFGLTFTYRHNTDDIANENLGE